jgi:hypothetical protein
LRSSANPDLFLMRYWVQLLLCDFSVDDDKIVFVFRAGVSSGWTFCGVIRVLFSSFAMFCSILFLELLSLAFDNFFHPLLLTQV